MSMAEASQRASARLKKASLIAEHKFFVLFVYLIAILVFYPYVRKTTFWLHGLSHGGRLPEFFWPSTPSRCGVRY